MKSLAVTIELWINYSTFCLYQYYKAFLILPNVRVSSIQTLSVFSPSVDSGSTVLTSVSQRSSAQRKQQSVHIIWIKLFPQGILLYITVVFLILTVWYISGISLISKKDSCGLFWRPKYHLKGCFYKCVASYKKQTFKINFCAASQ